MLQVARSSEAFAIGQSPRGRYVRALQHNDLPWVILMSEKGSRSDVIVDTKAKVLVYIRLRDTWFLRTASLLYHIIVLQYLINGRFLPKI